MPVASPLDRTALRTAYRMDETECITERLAQASTASTYHAQSAALATTLIEEARQQKVSGLDAFLHTYGLATEEGIAMMCLAEALLRVPDHATADALISDKLANIEWSEHLGESSSSFVNAATFSLMLTGEVLDKPEEHQRGMAATLRRAIGRLGEPFIRKAVTQAMRILGGQFVFGRTMDEALKRAAPERKRGLTHSFDMLGEAAITFADAQRYRQAYASAIARLAHEADNSLGASPGISVKLSALYPKFDFYHGDAAVAALVPILRDLAMQARNAGIHFTIDAEEAERLELSLDIVEMLAADDELFAGGWSGFGLAIQAYQKRALPLCEWVTQLARQYGRKFFVRLVKGAYWDTEIKLAQVGGLSDYPVFTRKVATDVSYLACAERLLAANDALFPAFATHNANMIGAIKAMAEQYRAADSDATSQAAPDSAAKGQQFEFQRLHGMGEDVYAALAAEEKRLGQPQTRVRIYAPVGGHKDLLAYLVRRLLENGANSSFVNRMADADIVVAELVTDPVAELTALEPKRNEAIPLPANIFPGRINSAGTDLSDPLVREPLLERLAALETREWQAAPTITGDGAGAVSDITSPQDRRRRVGSAQEASAADIDAAIDAAQAAQPGWDAIGGEKRATLLGKAAKLFEEHMDEFLSLCRREAGKTVLDSVLEVREAVDFLRYYANEARRQFTTAETLPGPTGEENILRLHGRGIFVTISPWNFPLAIFIGPAAAALAAGNTVLAKPAEQTPLIAALAVKLCHQAGIPQEVFQLVPGDGKVGTILTGDPRINGVAFTGSTSTAQAINRSLAMRDGPLGILIAETGGQNAMIVDSSALPEQVTRDVVASAFQSAGQRCSALRVLYLQDDIADAMLDMIRGAFEALNFGDPALFSTDIGPVIDAEAKTSLDNHIAAMKAAGHAIWQREAGPQMQHGCYVPPTIIEIGSIAELEKENFGPVLHVARYKAGELEQLIAQINAAGFGLTLGLHSRIEATHRLVQAKARMGNLYINRNQIGAVVGSQPFGGEGLSGTGPKAGGPHYVARFATERVTCTDTTAAGGNASLLAS